MLPAAQHAATCQGSHLGLSSLPSYSQYIRQVCLVSVKCVVYGNIQAVLHAALVIYTVSSQAACSLDILLSV